MHLVLSCIEASNRPHNIWGPPSQAKLKRRVIMTLFSLQGMDLQLPRETVSLFRYRPFSLASFKYFASPVRNKSDGTCLSHVHTTAAAR